MKYDFDTVVNRRNTDSLKWNVAENELPMWVADMDFKTAPEPWRYCPPHHSKKDPDWR